MNASASSNAPTKSSPPCPPFPPSSARAAKSKKCLRFLAGGKKTPQPLLTYLDMRTWGFQFSIFLFFHPERAKHFSPSPFSLFLSPQYRLLFSFLADVWRGFIHWKGQGGEACYAVEISYPSPTSYFDIEVICFSFFFFLKNFLYVCGQVVSWASYVCGRVVCRGRVVCVVDEVCVSWASCVCERASSGCGGEKGKCFPCR